MATADEQESQYRYAGFSHRSLSPRSFDRLRAERSDYFYTPKRGPSASTSNITITRPTKAFEAVTQFVELLSQATHAKLSEHLDAVDMDATLLSNKFTDGRSSSHYSSFLSMDGGDLSSSSSVFSSRSNSSISTVAEEDTDEMMIDEPSKPFSKHLERRARTTESGMFEANINIVAHRSCSSVSKD